MIEDAVENEIIVDGDEEAARELCSDYGKNEDEYLVEGAILTCDMATSAIKIVRGQVLGHLSEMPLEERKVTRLKVHEYSEVVGDTRMATIEDYKKDTNVEPFRCNCMYEPNEKETEAIFANLDECRKNGTCGVMMKLENKWENMIRETKYFDYERNGKQVEGITMLSMLFCSRGGLITPISSGQIYITRNSKGEGDYYLFKDIYNKFDQPAVGALQGFGGGGSILNRSGNHSNYGGQSLDKSEGTITYNGIKRHAIALGPKIQNPHFDTSSESNIDAEEMAYGTCVDITIELEGKTYYIPAVITDVKAHTAPNGYFQTGNTFGGESVSGGETGNIVEWYVRQKSDDGNKSAGLNSFSETGGLIIYRNEVME